MSKSIISTFQLFEMFPDKRTTTAVPFEVTKDGLIVDLRSIRPVVNRPTSTLIKRETLVAAE